MELLLNLAWALIAFLMVGLWFRFAPRARASMCMQLVALSVLLLILFPVVSVTDDLQAAQNPAEADCCLRRDHGCSTPHTILPPLADLPTPALTELSSGTLSAATPGGLQTPSVDHPELAPIQNRPPPAA